MAGAGRGFEFQNEKKAVGFAPAFEIRRVNATTKGVRFLLGVPSFESSTHARLRGARKKIFKKKATSLRAFATRIFGGTESCCVLLPPLDWIGGCRGLPLRFRESTDVALWCAAPLHRFSGSLRAARGGYRPETWMLVSSHDSSKIKTYISYACARK